MLLTGSDVQDMMPLRDQQRAQDSILLAHRTARDRSCCMVQAIPAELTLPGIAEPLRNSSWILLDMSNNLSDDSSRSMSAGIVETDRWKFRS
jgi:hypothetical protein